MISQIIHYFRQNNLSVKNVFIIIFLVFHTIASATDYYISSSGNDSNNGLSSSAPWKTIAKVNASSFFPGDRILFNKGDVWRETLTVPSSGDTNAPIIFCAYGIGAKPIIDGSNIVSIWTKVIGLPNVYYSTLSASTDQVFRDDLRATEGTSKVALNDHEWFCYGTTLYYRDDSGTPQGAGYVITASIRDNNIEIAKKWVGKDNITVSGIKVTKANGDAIEWPGAAIKTIITNCEINYAYQNGLRSTAGTIVSDVLVTLNDISWNGACGVNVITPSHDWEISYNNVFRNCQYADDIGNHNYNAGIHTWCEDGTVLRIRVIHNNVYSNGKLFGDTFITGVRGIGIHMDSPTATSHADGNFIAYNKVYDNHNKGISLERTTYQTVAYNVVYNNIGAYGIVFTQWSTDNPSAHNRVYNNVSYGNLVGIVILGASQQTANVCIDNEVKNNISVGNTIQQFDALYGGENDGTMGSGNVYINNCFGVFSAGTAYWGFGHQTNSYDDLEAHYGSSMYNTEADPMFVDATNGDFHLKAGSPCINAGVYVGLTTDYDGKAVIGLPDIGAFEIQPVISSTIPVYTSSVIENATPIRLEMTYNASLANIVPASSAFTVQVNSVSRSINSVVISGTKVLLTLASPIVYGNVVTVTYTKPASNELQTASGAIAVNISNQSVTNNCINNAPTALITSPITNSSFPALANITITVNVLDADGSVILVEFYNGSTLIGSKASSPYSFTWNNVAAGIYSLTAVATDNLNAKTVSSAISISVTNGSSNVNQLPVINIYNPLKGTKYFTNSTITIDAIASDPDGSISKVEFYNGLVKLVELTSAPYTYTWKDVKAGTYSITAIATDNLNGTTVSTPVEFVVGTNIKYDANSEIINLYPNPNDGHFSIEFINPLQNEKSEILITDLAGKQVYAGPVLKEETLKQFDLSNIKSGIYVMMIFCKELLVTKKFIIN